MTSPPTVRTLNDPTIVSVAGVSVAGVSVAGESVAGESVAGVSVAGESMTGETVTGDVARALANHFRASGAQFVTLPMIQPASIFLDALGEDLRARTYVFTDPDGHELCLRPDLTVPVVTAHLAARADLGMSAQQYTYDGLVFRYRAPTLSRANPREFRQVGLEFLGHQDPASLIDALMFERVVRAIEALGLKSYEIRLGDLALMHAALAAAPMPRRWRDQLAAHFAQPQAFKRLLKMFTTEPAAWTHGLPDALLAGLDRLTLEQAEARVDAYLVDTGQDASATTRTLTAMTERLRAAAADRTAYALPATLAAAIEALPSLQGAPTTAVDQFHRAAGQAGLDVTVAADSARARHALIETAGIDLRAARFDCAFGRKIAYYSGFVFELAVPGLGRENPVAGGGRYDRLLDLLDPGGGVTAAGAAIYVDRLVAAVPPKATARVPVTVRGLPIRPEPVPDGAAVAEPALEITIGTAPADRLVLAIPSKGRMMDDCLALFLRAGLEIRKVGPQRGYRGEVVGQPLIDVAFVSASEIAERIKAGDVHLGITGEDLVRETATDADARATFALKLGFGGADVVVAVPDCWLDVRAMADLNGVAYAFRRDHGHHMRVATKYRSLTRKFFRANDIDNYRIVDSLGATEGAPAAGVAELIVDITSTGETLRANGLRILDDGIMLRSEANLVEALRAPRTGAVADLERIIIARIKAVL